MTLVLAVASVILSAPASAASASVQMPFPCGETWYASSYSGHTPSQYSIDWNLQGNDQGRSVRAGVSGTATTYPNNGDYGNMVEVNAGDGWTFRYAHLSAFSIPNGAQVSAATEIGKVGSTGNSTGSHLHYEQRLNDVVKHATFNGSPIAYVPNFPGNPYISANCGQPPTAHMTQTTPKDDAVSFDGSASSDPDGYIASWEWSFGDGSTASGAAVSHFYPAPGTYTATLTVTDNAGSSASTSQTVSITSQHQFLADVNGDGNADAVIYFPDGNWYVALSNGTSFVRDPNTWLWLNEFGLGPFRPLLSDVNGDGKADAVAYAPGSGNWYVASSNGTSFVRDPNTWQWLAEFGAGPSQQHIGDVNGDGKADAVAFFSASGNWYVALSNGTTFVRNPSTWQWINEFGSVTGPRLLVHSQ